MNYTKETVNQMIERFMSKVMPEPNTGCWFWIGGTKTFGYGNFSIKDRTYSSHRVSFQFFKHNIPKGFMVLHSCDNPYCVNPDHLYLGTHRDNMNDKIKRGRSARQKGSDHGGSKLIECDIIEIRALLKSGMKQKEIAQKFNVDPSTISYINIGRKWQHV